MTDASRPSDSTDTPEAADSGRAARAERVRFAPSPTGYLHVGGLRTALYNYLIARQSGGAFVLRIEDTDRERFVEGAEDDLVSMLRWAGIGHDEGPDVGGPGGPYRQSERTARYRAAADRLVADGHAYLAFDTREEIEAARASAEATGGAFAYDARTRAAMRNATSLPASEVARLLDAGAEHVVRLRVDPGERIAFVDEIRGEVSFPSGDIDDQVLVKSDGQPTYHLANVVDDHAMGITLVVRGEEWLPSTPKHVLLYRALGYAPPRFAHLPLLLSPKGGKLSKRNADREGIPVSVRDYRAAGFEPEALVNFLALLGWNPGDDREAFTLDELVTAFSLDRVNNTGARFDIDKLRWMNAAAVRALSPEDIADRAREAVSERVGVVETSHVVAAAALMRERLVFARDLADAAYLFADPETYDETGVRKRWKPESARLVRAYADRLAALDPFDAPSAETALRDLAEAEGVGVGAIVHAVRLAVTGTTVGAGLFETIEVVGQGASVRRIARAADVLG